MCSVPDFEVLNRNCAASLAMRRVLPPGQAFVQLQSLSASDSVLKSATKLSDILDLPSIQSLISDFYNIVGIPMAVLDLEGRVLAGAGWQDICTKFHRVHPETCCNCVESDTHLTAGIRSGEYRLYKCKNNMWDVATPLLVGDEHVGNIFAGQFFFDDEPLDRDVFLQQAKRFAFDEATYLHALEAVPRLSRSAVATGMSFITKLAHLISEMSYSNVKLAEWMIERKQAEEALVRSEKLASVGRLAASVAHELNNPLAAATNCVFLARADKDVPQRVREYLELAERELQRAAHMASQTLGFYRESAKPTSFSMSVVTDEILKIFSQKIATKQLAVRVNHDKNSVPTFAVEGEIRQVISNLLANAIDASARSGQLSVHTNIESIGGRTYATITIADQGTGISKADRVNIFKPFFTTKEAIGTGLGLWVSSEIVTKHHGRIRLRSAAGKGTVFKVFLPQDRPPATL